MRKATSSLALALLLGCRNNSVESTAPRASASATTPAVMSSAPPPPSLPPLTGASWLEELPLSDGSLAYVAPPVGAREPRPLIVAVHGAGDRANWACGGWRLA